MPIWTLGKFGPSGNESQSWFYCLCTLAHGSMPRTVCRSSDLPWMQWRMNAFLYNWWVEFTTHFFFFYNHRIKHFLWLVGGSSPRGPTRPEHVQQCMYIWCGLCGGGEIDHLTPQHFVKCVVGVGRGCIGVHGSPTNFNLYFILNSDVGGGGHGLPPYFF